MDLSILLITYNNESYIEDTLKSILKQQVNFNYEIVVGDDCSTDKTFKIINTYSNKHPELFKVQKNKKQLGILRNFKTTLDRCKGTYVFDIAGDDLFKGSLALQKMLDLIKTNSNLGFIDSGYDRLEKNGLTSVFTNKPLINTSKEIYKKNLLLGKIVPIGTCYNKAYLYKYVDFDFYINQNITIEDYPILVDLVMNTEFEIMNESLHIYRIHESSYSHEQTFEKIYFLRTQMLNLFNCFKDKYFFSEKITKTYLQTHFKAMLFMAGYYEKKQLGKESFKNIYPKNTLDYIHFLASQNSTFRKIIKLKKKIKSFYLKTTIENK